MSFFQEKKKRWLFTVACLIHHQKITENEAYDSRRVSANKIIAPVHVTSSVGIMIS
jgi:hypothetical protein